MLLILLLEHHQWWSPVLTSCILALGPGSSVPWFHTPILQRGSLSSSTINFLFRVCSCYFCSPVLTSYILALGSWFWVFSWSRQPAPPLIQGGPPPFPTSPQVWEQPDNKYFSMLTWRLFELLTMLHGRREAILTRTVVSSFTLRPPIFAALTSAFFLKYSPVSGSKVSLVLSFPAHLSESNKMFNN